MKKIILLLLLVNLTACNKYYTYLHTEQDLAFSPPPSKQDSYAIDENPDASIEERNFSKVVYMEMLDNKFILDDKHPKYKIKISRSDKIVQVGATVDPLNSGRVYTNYSGEDWFTLSIYKADDPAKKIIWRGESGTKSPVYKVLRRSIIKSMLDYIGNNINEAVQLDKNYKENQ